MSGVSDSSVLVVCNRVYVKTNDGSFLPALVETKDEYCRYTVQFADGSRARVDENELVWLGFWGLPAFCWPRHPVIVECNPNDVNNAAAVFHNKNMFGRSDNEDSRNEKPIPPESFKIRTTEVTREKCFSGGGTRKRPCLDAQWDSTLSRTEIGLLNAGGELQPRSSVLRLNNHLLRKEVCVKSPERFVPLPSKGTLESSSSTQFSVLRNAVIEEPRSDDQSRSNSAYRFGRISQRIKPQHNNEVNSRINTNNLFSTIERLVNQSDGTGLLNEEVEQENEDKYISPFKNFEAAYPSTKWTDDLHQCHVAPRLTTSPSNMIAPQSPSSVDKVDRTPQSNGSSTAKTSEICNEKREKKVKTEVTKKCRKVFGVNNRHAWCVQCRWKKACSRFRRDSS